MELWEYNLLSMVKRRWIPLTVIFLLLTAGFGYAYGTTPTTVTTKATVAKTLYRWSGWIGGTGVVSRPNQIWDVGKRVELPIYPVSIMPVAEIALGFNVSGKDVNLEFEREMRVVYYISYDKERVIEKTYLSVSNSSTGGSFTDHLLLNVSDVFTRIEIARNILKLPRESTGVEIIGKIRYSGTVDGKPVKGSQEFKGSISFPYEGFYKIEGDSRNGTQTFTKTVTETRAVNQRKRALFLSLSVLFGVLAAATVFIGRKFDPGAYSVEELTAERERKKLAKWISSGKLPKSLPAKRIELASLTDLVEAAIDMNKRVIHDAEKGVYFFLNEGVLYYFQEKTSEGEK
ncbi:DUF5305 family protein [Thermococcus radiotolerans]|uniref:DUF5305 domain-containing protein n=1 Tax=Thermococcus radiotolerans TaxID=187880 RepID=A0A2Z2N4G1_9EURY|nr:DUF5305 family protein [Thermococcus radiotolerans]ASJ15270.1 hypothetical protein A3L10_09065 [Thermococcus radiotolerans]